MSNYVSDQELVTRPPEMEQPYQILMRLAGRARLFRSDGGRYYARVAVGDRHEILDMRSPSFREWLINAFVGDQAEMPPGWALTRVLASLEARARFEPGESPVFIRVGRETANADKVSFRRNVHGEPAVATNDSIAPWIIDLGNSSGRAVRIEAGGWSIVDQPSIHFRRPAGIMAFPSPARDGSIELLRPYVNLNSQDFQLLVAWLVAALRPVGPYPVLVLHGEQGSAKSTLSRIIRLLVDPQAAPLLAPPSGNRDLMIAAFNGWLLAFDNISSIPHWMSDGFCRLSTGGAFTARTLYSNETQTIVEAQRPVILNGIDEFVRRGDLSDRTLILNLPPIHSAARLAEQDLWASFHQYYPRILGGLFDAIVGGLRLLPTVQLTDLPRMADFARLGEAVSRGLGWREGSFLEAYNDNRRQATLAPLEESMIATALLSLIGPVVTSWTGTCTALLESLTNIVGKKNSAAAGWPKNCRTLGSELRRIAPQLRVHGLSIDFVRGRNGRLIRLSTETTPVQSITRN